MLDKILISILNTVQKQPPKRVPEKRCSENMQQIYRRTPKNTFSLEHLWWATSDNPRVHYYSFQVLDLKRRIFFFQIQHLSALHLLSPSSTDHFLTLASYAKIEKVVLK